MGMAIYGSATIKEFVVWNPITNLGVTGDAANLTITVQRWDEQGNALSDVTILGSTAGMVVEDGPDGWYYLTHAALTAAVMSAHTVRFKGVSTTANTLLIMGEALRTVKKLVAATATNLSRDYVLGETIEIIQRVDYRETDGTAIRLTDVGGQVLPSAGTALRLNVGSVRHSGEAFEVTGQSVSDGDDLVARFDVLASDSVAMVHTGRADYYVYELVDGTWRKLDVRGTAEIMRGPRVVT